MPGKYRQADRPGRARGGGRRAAGGGRRAADRGRGGGGPPLRVRLPHHAYDTGSSCIAQARDPTRAGTGGGRAPPSRGPTRQVGPAPWGRRAGPGWGAAPAAGRWRASSCPRFDRGFPGQYPRQDSTALGRLRPRCDGGLFDRYFRPRRNPAGTLPTLCFGRGRGPQPARHPARRPARQVVAALAAAMAHPCARTRLQGERGARGGPRAWAAL
jgi:hypothetical protein